MKTPCDTIADVEYILYLEVICLSLKMLSHKTQSLNEQGMPKIPIPKKVANHILYSCHEPILNMMMRRI